MSCWDHNVTRNRLLALAGVLAAYGQDQAKPAADGENGHYSNGLLEMSIGEVKETPDTPGPVRSGLPAITLKDVSISQSTNVLEWDHEAQYECEVLDPAGKPAPLTAKGEKLRVPA